MKRARFFGGLGLVGLGFGGLCMLGHLGVSLGSRPGGDLDSLVRGRTAMFWGQVVAVRGSTATVDIRGRLTEMCLDELSVLQRGKLPTEAPGWMVYQASGRGLT